MDSEFAPGAWYLERFAVADAAALLGEVAAVIEAAPFRRMQTPGGREMSAALSNCGTLGWISDRRGYRYLTDDPLTHRPWPAIPPNILRVAVAAAYACGFENFTPDACLINRYAPGARMSLHQDRNERDFAHPIVSFSLGLPAVFLFGGETRAARPRRLPLQHGDVVVWGGPARLRFHGVMPIAAGVHSATGAFRINLTARRAG